MKEEKIEERKAVRREAAALLGELADEGVECCIAVPALLEALNDEDEEVRDRVAWALGKIGDVRALPALVEALRDKSSKVRFRAAVAIGRLSEKSGDCSSAVPALLEALNDEDEEVRREAVRALGKIGDVRAIPHILNFLNDDQYALSTLSRDMVKKILEKNSVAAIPYIIDALKRD